MNLSRYRSIVKSSAIYDLIFTFAFAIPGLALLKIEFLFNLHHKLGYTGSFPTFEPMHLFFVHLLGVVVIVWSVLRVKHPHPLLGLYDAYARFGFSAIMAYILFYQQGTELLWFFLIPEFIWGVYQLYGYVQLQKEEGVEPMTNTPYSS